MERFNINLSNCLKGNKNVNIYFDNLIVAGENPWELCVEVEWKDIGKLKISSFELSDFWALKDFWNNSLNYSSKNLFPLFPVGDILERAIANHYKNHKNKRDIIFNSWLLKDGTLNEDFTNEIIGHFFINRIDTEPEPGLVVADRYQGKKLGTFFIILMIYITKILKKKTIYIRTDINNKRSFDLYEKIGFKHIKDTPLEIPVVGYNSIIRELKMDLRNFK